MARVNTLQRRGEEMTVYRFSRSGTDEYGNAEYDSESESTKGYIEVTRKAEEIDTSAGHTAIVESRIFLPQDITIHDAGTDDSKPTEIHREKTNNRYVVQFSFNEGKDIQRCECIRK